MAEQRRCLQGDYESLRRERAEAELVAARCSAQLCQELEDHRCVAEANVRARKADILKLQEELVAAMAAAKAAEAAHEREERTREDAKILEQQFAALSGQNRELLSSVEVLQSDYESMQAQVRCAMESEDMVQRELDRGRDSTARAAGHSNHRQKIQYMLNLKEESIALRGDLRKAQQRLAVMEQCQRSEAGGRLSLRPHSRASLTGDAKLDAAAQERLRIQQRQERELERLATEYKHLCALVRRAAAHDEGHSDEPLFAWLRGQQTSVSAGLNSTAVEGGTDSAACVRQGGPAAHGGA